MAQHYIIGIDEAGRGPWAGPVVVGGFLCPVDFDFSIFSPFLNDSKKMKPSEREEVFSQIEKVIGGEISREVCRCHFASRDTSDIDTLGIREANRQAMEEVILSLVQFLYPTDTVAISIDGCDNYRFADWTGGYVFAEKKNAKSKNIQKDPKAQALDIPTETHSITYVIWWDGSVPVISVASVVAKVIRDRVMCEFHEEFPEYGFDTHKGYGTRKHHEALINYGISTIHRKSYAPIKRLISGDS